MTNTFFGFWDSNTPVNNTQFTQIKLWAKSILFFHPNSQIHLYTKKNIIPINPQIQNLFLIYMDNFQPIFDNTPLQNFIIPTNISKPELSDIIRIALLFKYGGTWIDIDDIIIRPIPKEKNIIGTFLWKNNKSTATYWGSTFNLANGNLINPKYNNYGFHIQNDPMINWEKNNQFLAIWMEKIKNYKSSDWGQKLPTNIIKYNPHFIQNYNITLTPQHHLLLHPAFGNNKQFGFPNSKGPMFPPYDLRISGKTNYDDLINQNEFWNITKQTLQLHSHFCIKNSKNIGITQCNENKPQRWLVGFLCDINNFNNILLKIKNLENS